MNIFVWKWSKIATEFPQEMTFSPLDFGGGLVKKMTIDKVINLLAPYYRSDRTGMTKVKLPEAAELTKELMESSDATSHNLEAP